MRWRLIGEIAFRIDDEPRFREAVAGLREVDAHDVTADLLQVSWDRKTGLDEAFIHDRLRKIGSALETGAEMAKRYLVALELRDQGLPEEASSLLEGYVDLGRASPAAILYLQSLAAARRDSKFRVCLLYTSPSPRD